MAGIVRRLLVHLVSLPKFDSSLELDFPVTSSFYCDDRTNARSATLNYALDATHHNGTASGCMRVRRAQWDLATVVTQLAQTILKEDAVRESRA
jgi:hypothetical protein